MVINSEKLGKKSGNAELCKPPAANYMYWSSRLHARFEEHIEKVKQIGSFLSKPKLDQDATQE